MIEDKKITNIKTKLIKIHTYTGEAQIIGRISLFFNYFVTKNEKNTGEKLEDPRLIQALSNSILFASKFQV